LRLPLSPSQTKLDRLARDFPDLHEEVKADYLTVHRASIQAGFIREAPAKRTIVSPEGGMSQRERYEEWITKSSQSVRKNQTIETFPAHRAREREVAESSMKSRQTPVSAKDPGGCGYGEPPLLILLTGS
jgi:hypothetical protein